MPFSLLHISDIHFGPHIRCGDDLLAAASKLADEVAADLSRLGLLPVDAVVASGDFTQRAEREEFVATEQFLRSLSGAIETPIGSFVIVPGNHDIAWYAPGSCLPSPAPNLRSEAKAGYEEFCRRLRGDGTTKVVPVCNADVALFRGQNPPVAIVGFNSARFEDPRTAGLGYVGEGQILELLLAIREQGVDENWIKIAVLHHHLVPVLDINLKELLKPKEERKFTMMSDAPTVLNFLLADGFGLILHGHMHTAFCAIERRAALSHFPRVPAGEILVHGAGTLGMDESEGDRENHFSVVSVSPRRVLIDSISRRIVPHATPPPAKSLRTTIDLRRSQELLELPRKAYIKHMRVREDARETWLDMDALARGNAAFGARFKIEVRAVWAAIGESGAEPQFTRLFEKALAEFSAATLKLHETELETTQLTFLQYFLGLMERHKRQNG